MVVLPPPHSEDVENKGIKTLEPKTRLEYFLNKIAEANGGGGSGSGGDSGSILVIDDTNEEIGLTIANPLMPETLMNVPGIMVDTEIDVGTVIVEAHHDDSSLVTYSVTSRWGYATASGVDPSQVSVGRYTFAGSRIVWVFGDDGKVIVPPSLAKDLVRGTKDEDIE